MNASAAAWSDSPGVSPIMHGIWQPPFSCTKRVSTSLAFSVEITGIAVGVGCGVGVFVVFLGVEVAVGVDVGVLTDVSVAVRVTVELVDKKVGVVVLAFIVGVESDFTVE